MYRSTLQIPLIAGLAAVLYTYLPLGSKTYCYSSITTLSPDTPENANCFTVARDGTITDVFYSATADVIPGNVLPGLTDGHGHLLQYGELLNSVNLFGAQSLEEVRSRIKEYMLLHPEAGSEERWIRGVGWDQAAYGRMPTAVSLDFPHLLTSFELLILTPTPGGPRRRPRSHRQIHHARPHRRALRLGLLLRALPPALTPPSRAHRWRNRTRPRSRRVLRQRHAPRPFAVAETR